MGVCCNDSMNKYNKTKQNNHFCNNGHPLEWQGDKFIYNGKMKCDKCGKYSNIYNPIRWKCSKCNLYFCSICYDITISRSCPVYHIFKSIKNDNIDDICDKCYQNIPKNESKFHDEFCKLTFCSRCFNLYAN